MARWRPTVQGLRPLMAPAPKQAPERLLLAKFWTPRVSLHEHQDTVSALKFFCCRSDILAAHTTVGGKQVMKESGWKRGGVFLQLCNCN